MGVHQATGQGKGLDSGFASDPAARPGQMNRPAFDAPARMGRDTAQKPIGWLPTQQPDKGRLVGFTSPRAT